MNKLEELKKSLELLGLNTNAVKFYLASYKHGVASVGKIARIIKIDRSSAYLALEQLEKKGLIIEEKGSKVKKIFASSPKVIVTLLRSRSRKLKNQYFSIEEKMPELLAEYSDKGSQPILQFFSGRDGLNRITDDILDSCKDELLVFSNQKEEKRVFNKIDHKEFVKERLKNNINVRVLAPDTPEAHNLQKNDSVSLRETIIIDEKEIPFKNEIYIYANKIAMLEFVDNIQGFIVKSPAFNQAQRWIFEKIWERYKNKKL